ncbi:hypothetical protein IPG41_02270 [Candidatus Peregrinibacteria bacterium]|nr:MAG: hypothetical protein IPG41_02270 [Candidatus Peregrinibacteria bacterium]
MNPSEYRDALARKLLIARGKSEEEARRLLEEAKGSYGSRFAEVLRDEDTPGPRYEIKGREFDEKYGSFSNHIISNQLT